MLFPCNWKNGIEITDEASPTRDLDLVAFEHETNSNDRMRARDWWERWRDARDAAARPRAS